MSYWRRIFTVTRVLSCFGLAFLVADWPQALFASQEGADVEVSSQPVVAVGDQAPAFFLNAVNASDIGRRRIVLEDKFRDEKTKAVIISFFATWCAPCMKELPLLQQLFEKYRDEGLRVVVISIDREPEALETLSSLIKEHGVEFPVVSDRFAFLARRYLGTSTMLPSIFICDSEGVFRTIHQGYGEGAEDFLGAEVRKLLGLKELPSESDQAADVAPEAASDAG